MHSGTNGNLRKNEVAYDDTPPRPGPAIFVRRLKGEEQIVVCILGDHVHGVWSHWSGKKSEPHFQDPDQCPGCQARRPKRWKGYIHVWDYGSNREIFLELTPHSATQLYQQLGRKTELRGERVNVQRTKGDNGRLRIAVLATEQKVAVLPKEKDPRPTILKLWGIDQEDPDDWLENTKEEDPNERFKL